MATAIGTYATTALLKELIGTTDSDDDTLIGKLCDRINQYIEDTTGRVIAPISSTTYLYDGDGTSSLFLPLPVDKAPIGGIRAITLLEVQPYTGGDFETVTSTDYFLRNRVGMTGPFERLLLSDRSSGRTIFPAGLGTVRVTGTAGWTAIPDDITETALVIAQRAWNARQVGYQDIVGLDETGRPTVARFVSGRDRELLRRYRLEMVLA
jgi:hypothetical protein